MTSSNAPSPTQYYASTQETYRRFYATLQVAELAINDKATTNVEQLASAFIEVANRLTEITPRGLVVLQHKDKNDAALRMVLTLLLETLMHLQQAVGSDAMTQPDNYREGERLNRGHYVDQWFGRDMVKYVNRAMNGEESWETVMPILSQLVHGFIVRHSSLLAIRHYQVTAYAWLILKMHKGEMLARYPNSPATFYSEQAPITINTTEGTPADVLYHASEQILIGLGLMDGAYP